MIGSFREFRYPYLLIAALAIVVGGCAGGGQEDPRQVVIAMFGAMERDDKAALTHLLDLPELMRQANEDYSLQTSQPRNFISPEDVLDDLTGEGKTKTTWFALQRIVNKARITGDAATVEVTFVDKDESKGYRTKFGLHRIEERWRIYSFKTFQEAP